MKQKLLLSFMIFCAIFSLNAQTISILGDFSGWQDVNMLTDDNVEYYLEGVAFEANGNVKFRQDGSWDINWGSNTFPMGTGTQGGSDIPVIAGVYDVYFDITTGDYEFDAVLNDYDVIGFIGAFNGWSESVDMVTIDGDIYTFKDQFFSEPDVKFRKDNNWDVSWGGTTFPSGNAILNGENIPLSTGFYNVTFFLNNLSYSFETVPVTMIGPAVSDWDTDVTMTTEDGGKTFTAAQVVFSDGELKFRVNNAWSLNYGGTTFPEGTANPNSENETPISVQAGTYDVTFDRVTLTYTFISTLSNPENEFSEVKIYPNPTSSQWIINLGEVTADSITFTDISGKVILNSEHIQNEFLIDASGFETGIYFLSLTNENGRKTFKLVKN